jgi:hypothetical protein
MKTLKIMEGKLKEQNPEVCMSLFYGRLRRTQRWPRVLLGSSHNDRIFHVRCTCVFIQSTVQTSNQQRPEPLNEICWSPSRSVR